MFSEIKQTERKPKQGQAKEEEKVFNSLVI